MAKKIITLKNANPIASEMWDFKLNEKLHPGVTPDNVASDSMNKAWFKCTDNPVHIFKTKIKDMTDRTTGKNCGCVFCGPRADRKFADVVKPLSDEIIDIEDIWSPMNTKSYTEYEADSSERVKWICKQCGQTFTESIEKYIFANKFNRKGSCPYCNESKPLAGFNTLETVFDDIDSRWSEHNKKSYQECTKTSLYIAIWICQECGKEFVRNVASYVKASSFGKKKVLCPECEYADRIITQGNPAAGIENIDEVWDDEKDYKNYPSDSNEIIRWKCPNCGGRFDMGIANYIYMHKFKDTPCPYCSGKEPLAGFNTIETVMPDVAEVWSDTNEKSYSDYLPDSYEYAEWVCRKCHGTYRFPIDLYIFFAESGISECPYCQNLKPKVGFNTLEVFIDDIDDVWSPKNKLNYTEYLFNDDRESLFICPKCHGTYLYHINRYVNARQSGIETCPYCQNKIALAGFNSVETVVTNIDDVWDKGNKKNYNELTIDSSYKARWNCQNCGGVFKRTVKDYIYNYKNNRENCPYCAGTRVLAGYNSIDTILDNISDVWSNNNDRSYTEFSTVSYEIVEWHCPVCKGSFEKIICDYVKQIKAGENPCPYCAGKKALAGFNSLDTVIDNIDDVWEKINKKSYTELLPTSSYVANWKCSTCHGVYKKRVSDYVKSIKNGKSICPYCNNKEPLAGFNTIETVNSDWLEEWSYRDNYLLCRPDEITPNSAHKVWWKCKECGYIYKMAPKTRAMFEFRHRKPCPCCKGLRRKKHYI